jgi:hypothetical protein
VCWNLGVLDLGPSGLGDESFESGRPVGNLRSNLHVDYCSTEVLGSARGRVVNLLQRTVVDHQIGTADPHYIVVFSVLISAVVAVRGRGVLGRVT